MREKLKSLFREVQRLISRQQNRSELTSDDYRIAGQEVATQLQHDLGVELNFDEQSIEWLDGYINRCRESMPKETKPGLAAALGAYVGEAIIKTYGGAWTYNEQTKQWGIKLNDGNIAFPIAKVYKQLEEDEFHSVHSFFTILPLIGKIASAPPNSTVDRASE